MNQVSGRIKNCRQKMGMTQKDLAEVCGLTTAAISKLENEHLNAIPSASTLVQMAIVFGVSERWIMTGEEAIESQASLFKLDDEEKQMIYIFRSLSLIEKKIAIRLAKVIKE